MNRTQASWCALILATLVAAQTAVRTVWHTTNTDTPTVLAMVAKDADETLYSRDAYFRTRDHYKGYIPLYRRVLLTCAKAGGSPWRGMLILFPATLLLILTGLWLVAREATGRLLLAVPVAVAASFIRDTGGGNYWGMTWDTEPLARFLFLGLALFAFLPLLRCWPRVSLRVGVFSLAAAAALSNLHPPSALGWFLALAVLILLGSTGWKTKLGTLAAGGGLGALAATPSALATLQHAAQFTTSLHHLYTIEPFSAMARAVLDAKEGVFPWVMRPLRGGQFLPGREWLWCLLIAYVACMIAWGVYFGLRGSERRSGRASWNMLLLIHIPLFFISSRMRAVDLSVVLLALLILRWHVRPVQRLEWLGAALTACVLAVAWMGSAAIRIVWQVGDLRILSQLVVNFGRCVRLVYLPVWILAALWVRRRASRATAFSLAVTFIAFVYPWRGTAAFFILTLVGVACTEYFARRKQPSFAVRAALHALLVAALALGLAYYKHGIAPLRFKLLLSVVAGATAFAGQYALRYSGSRRWALACVSIVPLAAGWWVERQRLPAELRRAREYITACFTMTDPVAAERDLMAWAKANTPKDTLFYLSDSDLVAHRFRALSQRSVVYTFKAAPAPTRSPRSELSFQERKAYWARPFEVKDWPLLQKRAGESDADYVVVRSDFPASARCEVVYKNNLYSVFRTEQ